MVDWTREPRIVRHVKEKPTSHDNFYTFHHSFNRHFEERRKLNQKSMENQKSKPQKEAPIYSGEDLRSVHQKFVVRCIIPHVDNDVDLAWRNMSPFIGANTQAIKMNGLGKLSMWTDHLERCSKFEQLFQAMTDQHIPISGDAVYKIGNDTMKIHATEFEQKENTNYTTIKIHLVSLVF